MPECATPYRAMLSPANAGADRHVAAGMVADISSRCAVKNTVVCDVILVNTRVCLGAGSVMSWSRTVWRPVKIWKP
jgi:hypothetical protein